MRRIIALLPALVWSDGGWPLAAFGAFPMAAAWSYGGQLLGVSALAIGDECAGARSLTALDGSQACVHEMNQRASNVVETGGATNHYHYCY